MNSTHNNICNIAFLLSPLSFQGSRWQLWKWNWVNKEKRKKMGGERGFNCKHEEKKKKGR
jgi:hypothetical protein